MPLTVCHRLAVLHTRACAKLLHFRNQEHEEEGACTLSAGFLLNSADRPNRRFPTRQANAPSSPHRALDNACKDLIDNVRYK